MFRAHFQYFSRVSFLVECGEFLLEYKTTTNE